LTDEEGELRVEPVSLVFQLVTAVLQLGNVVDEVKDLGLEATNHRFESAAGFRRAFFRSDAI
jgi:hypothetical protein